MCRSLNLLCRNARQGATMLCFEAPFLSERIHKARARSAFGNEGGTCVQDYVAGRVDESNGA